MSRKLCAVALVGAFLPGTVAARSLHWNTLEVEARLDADGRLHVIERHSMVFDGDHNGGQPVFDPRPGAVLELHGVRRLDPATGRHRPLRPGDLSAVDDYSLDGRELRWRSRLPTDSPFEQATLVYEIDYTLSRVVVAMDGGGYRLEHDFSIPDRPGTIERFALDIKIDPPWRLESDDDFDLGGTGGGAHWRVEGGPQPPG